MDEFNQNNQINETNPVPPVNNPVPPAGGYNYGAPAPGGQPVVPESGKATASMVLGIISIVCWFFGWSTIASLILSIVGLVLASQAKAAGNDTGTRKAGFVLNLIGLIGGAVFLVACVACAGALAAYGSM